MTAAFPSLVAAARRRPELVAKLAVQALAERREDEALPIVAAAAAAAPKDATLHQLAGLLHRALGDLAPAIAALDRAVVLAPHDGRLLHARARAALEAGLPSLEWFARARRLAPNDGDVILGEAAALLAERSGGAADALLSGMLAEHPGWLPGHDTLIRLRHAIAHAAPFSMIDGAIRDAPRDSRLHRLKVVALHRSRAGAAALEAAAAARRALDDDATARLLTAMVATEYGDRAEADAAFERVDPLSDSALAVHWWRHLLRRGEPARISSEAEALSEELRDLVWPYLSAAWRLIGDPRASWLDDPRLVRTFQLSDDSAWLAQLAETLRPLHVARAEPIDQSVRGGTQTDGPLFSRVDPMIQALKSKVVAAVDRYLAELPPADPRHPLLGRKPRQARFAGSWSVRLTARGHHDPHIHTEGRVSSAFYTILPPPGSNQAGWLSLGEPQRQLGTGLAALHMVSPRPGMLALFPSTMWHGTRPFAAGERLTVAFDVA